MPEKRTGIFLSTGFRRVDSADQLQHPLARELFTYWKSTGSGGTAFDLLDVPDLVPWCYFVRVNAVTGGLDVRLTGSELVERLSIDLSGLTVASATSRAPRAARLVRQAYESKKAWSLGPIRSNLFGKDFIISEHLAVPIITANGEPEAVAGMVAIFNS